MTITCTLFIEKFITHPTEEVFFYVVNQKLKYRTKFVIQKKQDI